MNVTDHRVPSIFHVLHVADGPLLDVPGGLGPPSRFFPKQVYL